MPSSYGTGADGAVVISTNTTLTGDKNYTTLVVNNGVTLNVAGYIVRCSVSLTNNGIITSNTEYAAAGAGGGTGGTGGTAYNSDYIYAYGGSGGGGGTGGTGGGRVRLYAKTFTNNGTIHANGGNATAGSNGGTGGKTTPDKVDHVAGGGGGGGGGGANGGNGGEVSLIYETRTTGTVIANGGTGSSGGTGGGVSSLVGDEAWCSSHQDGSAGGARAGKGGDSSNTSVAPTSGDNGTTGSTGSAGSITWTYEKAPTAPQIWMF